MKKHIVFDMRTGEVIKVEEIPADVDPREWMRKAVHDCPECRAAMERGEVPQFGTFDPELELPPPRPRFWRRPRWRTLKRMRGR